MLEQGLRLNYSLNRRDFLKSSGLTLAAAALSTLPDNLSIQSPVPCDYDPKKFVAQNCPNIYPRLLEKAIISQTLDFSNGAMPQISENLALLIKLQDLKAPISIAPDSKNHFPVEKLIDIARILRAYDLAFGPDLVNNIFFISADQFAKFNHGRTPGFYNTSTKTVILRDYKGVEQLAHELGHAAARKFGLNELFLEIGSSINRSDPQSQWAYASGYARRLPGSEDVSEVLQDYVSNGEKLRGRIITGMAINSGYARILAQKYEFVKQFFNGEEYGLNGRIWISN